MVGTGQEQPCPTWLMERQRNRFLEDDDFQDSATDWGVPAMIALGTEESLEHRRTTRVGLGIVVFDEIFGIVGVVIQNVKDGVGLGFHPKGIHRLDVAIYAHDIVRASGDDDVWILVVFIKGTYVFFE
jgi:hypothetical protein